MAKSKSISYTTSNIPTRGMGQAIDEMMSVAKTSRRGHERRWYDNNYFDDGYHFRYVSRQKNKVVDWAERTSIYNPLRAIPKASRQIRGVINLLISNELVPVVYPENINKIAYPDQEQIDPQTGQPVRIPHPEYLQALEEAKRVAKGTGHWLMEEFKKQEIKEKITLMGLLAAKSSIAYLKVWPDAVNEKIKTTVRDSFDVYTLGQYTELEDVPFIIEAAPRSVAEIKADENFDPEQIEKITPDNRHASSEIKEAYMLSRYGGRPATDQAATLIQKEAFIKEYMNDDNMERIRKQEDGGEILKNRKKSDPVLRHTFSAGGIWLKDKYIDMSEYPYAEFRFEPGPLYQVPLIERFIPSNKSLDMIVSRIERYAHTMGVGVYLKKKGENVNISNKAGGQMVEYENVPPTQMNLQQLPPMFFNYINLINSFIEEQGVSTTALSKLPSGVKSGVAIESLKESEFANLVTANQRLKKTIRSIAKKFLNLADDYFVSPQTYFFLERGEPQYFDVIGAKGIEKRNGVNLETPKDIIPISKDYNIEIEVQSGLGYTREGRKAAAKELGDYLIQLAQINMLPPNMIVAYLDKLFEVYQFGVGSEVIEDMEKFVEEGQMTNPQIDAMKVAVAEVIKDSGLADDKTEEDIQKTKVAVAEAAKDLGGQNESQ